MTLLLRTLAGAGVQGVLQRVAQDGAEIRGRTGDFCRYLGVAVKGHPLVPGLLSVKGQQDIGRIVGAVEGVVQAGRLLDQCVQILPQTVIGAVVRIAAEHPQVVAAVVLHLSHGLNVVGQGTVILLSLLGLGGQLPYPDLGQGGIPHRRHGHEAEIITAPQKGHIEEHPQILSRRNSLPDLPGVEEEQQQYVAGAGEGGERPQVRPKLGQPLHDGCAQAVEEEEEDPARQREVEDHEGNPLVKAGIKAVEQQHRVPGEQGGEVHGGVHKEIGKKPLLDRHVEEVEIDKDGQEPGKLPRTVAHHRAKQFPEHDADQRT